MEDKIVDFETAKLAKEVGFEFNTNLINNTLVIHKTGNQLSTRGLDFSDKNRVEIIPTQSLLQKWLREIYKIHIICDPADDNAYAFQVGKVDDMEWVLNENKLGKPIRYFETYEEGLEVALVRALNKIKDEIR